MDQFLSRLRPTVLILALLAGIPATVCGIMLLRIFDRMVQTGADLSNGETVLVALLSGTVGSYIGGVLVLAGHVARPDTKGTDEV